MPRPETLTEVFEMPWYAKILLLSQPLHFGDYGGLPLKIIWALLDLITIIVLGQRPVSLVGQVENG